MTPDGEFFILGPSGESVWVCEQDLKGLAFTANNTATTIYVKPAVDTEDLLDSWCHEAMHILHPKATERTVEKYAGFLSRLLWKAGYRKTKLEKKHGRSVRRR
jgi:hypothetical protein